MQQFHTQRSFNVKAQSYFSVIAQLVLASIFCVCTLSDAFENVKLFEAD